MRYEVDVEQIERKAGKLTCPRQDTEFQIYYRDTYGEMKTLKPTMHEYVAHRAFQAAKAQGPIVEGVNLLKYVFPKEGNVYLSERLPYPGDDSARLDRWYEAKEVYFGLMSQKFSEEFSWDMRKFIPMWDFVLHPMHSLWLKMNQRIKNAERENEELRENFNSEKN